ncbi:MAG TPA: hypothetical protein VFE30_17585 [Anaeromyxobacteraceae bacterium]|jgi:O-antigen/teichoic acid export membrane protein|nr:hypothetical protein [Anaeromyxobacteraceae bacterium]
MPAHQELASAAERPPQRAAGGVVATWVRLLVITLVGVAQAPILFRHIPADELGVWYLFFALATFVNLSDLGLPSTFQRAASYLWGRQRSGVSEQAPGVPSIYRAASLPELYASALLATAGLAMAFAAAVFPAALLYFRHALPRGSIQSHLLVPLLVFLLGVVLNAVAAIPGACLSGCGRVALDNWVRTAANLLGFGLICLLVPVHRSLNVLCAIYVIQGLTALVVSHLAINLTLGTGRWRELRLDLPLVRSMYRESFPIFVSRIGGWLTVESTLLIAGYVLGSERIADLGVLRQMVAIGASITAAIPLAVSPQVAAAHAAGDEEQVRSLYLATLRYALVVNVLWTVGLLVWGPVVIGVLVGAEHFLGYGVLVPLALGSLLELHGITHAFFVWNVGKWPFAPYVLAGGLLNLLLASLGCATHGFVGLAWGTITAQALTVWWVQAWFALQQLGVSLRSYLAGTVVRVGLYGATLAAAGVGIHWFVSTRFPLLAAAAGGIVGTTLVSGLLAWLVVLTEGDRAYFLRLLRIRPSTR